MDWNTLQQFLANGPGIPVGPGGQFGPSVGRVPGDYTGMRAPPLMPPPGMPPLAQPLMPPSLPPMQGPPVPPPGVEMPVPPMPLPQGGGLPPMPGQDFGPPMRGTATGPQLGGPPPLPPMPGPMPGPGSAVSVGPVNPGAALNIDPHPANDAISNWWNTPNTAPGNQGDWNPPQPNILPMGPEAPATPHDATPNFDAVTGTLRSGVEAMKPYAEQGWEALKPQIGPFLSGLKGAVLGPDYTMEDITNPSKWLDLAPVGGPEADAAPGGGPSLNDILKAMGGGTGPGANVPGGAGGSAGMDLGTALPQDLYMPAKPTMVGTPDYSSLMKFVTDPQRIQRQVADPMDYSAADKAMAEAGPEARRTPGNFQGAMEGLARALMNMDDSAGLGDLLFKGSLGALLGVAGSNRERYDAQTDYERENNAYQRDMANYDLLKGQGQREAKQQGLDAQYEADLGYEQGRQGANAQRLQIGTHGLDAAADAMRANAGLATNYNQALKEGQRAYAESRQPQFKVGADGTITTVRTDPTTGKITADVDRTGLVQKYQMMKMLRTDNKGLENMQEMFPEYGSSGLDPMMKLAYDLSASPSGVSDFFGADDKASQDINQAVTSSPVVVGDPKQARTVYAHELYNRLMGLAQNNPSAFLETLRQRGYAQ